MKRFAATVLSIILILSLTMTALADSSTDLFYDSVMELLFQTNNVTLNGQAEFLLDGERFKTAELRYIQDYTNSLYQLNLHTPRRNGSQSPDRESGYTIIANGEKVYVMEVIYPGVYKTGTTYAQSTILRKSVQLNLMTELVRMLAGQADTLPGDQAVTVQPDGQGGKELHITLGEDVPEIVNTVLNVFYQFAAKRYFETDYDYVSEQDMGLMEHYLTVTEGILRTTKHISLKQAHITMQVNGHGQTEQIKGDVSLFLNTGRDGTRQLDFTFSLNVSDLDSSHVDKFDPSEYGVRPAK